MTNFEHYTEQIKEMIAEDIAIKKDDGKIEFCCDADCRNCVFHDGKGPCDDKRKRAWLDDEYVEPPVDWSKVPVDTPISVRNSEDQNWEKDTLQSSKMKRSMLLDMAQQVGAPTA